MAALQDTLEAVKLAAERVVLIKDENGDAKALQLAVHAGLMLLAELRQRHSAAALEVEAIKDETAEFKAHLDKASLQLHNLQYEKQYYEKEIQSCRSFQSAVSEDAVDLVPLQQFLQLVPPEVLASAGDDPHKLMLARLTFELNQRRELSRQLQALQACKQEEADKAAARKGQLDDLQQHLRTLEAATKPLQEALAPTMPLRQQHRLAELLPLPLYVVYAQFAAAQEALGLPLEAAIAGSAEEAARLASNALGGASSSEAEGGEGAPNGDEGAGALGAMAVRPAKRQRRQLSDAELYKVHPLSVVVTLFRQGTAEQLLELHLEHFTSANLLGAYCPDADDNSVLASLFPGDRGDAEGLEPLAALHPGPYEFGTRSKGRPYRWAQDLAGMDVMGALLLPGAAAGSGFVSGVERREVLEGLATLRRQQRVQTVVERLEAVKRAVAALKDILLSLSKKQAPATPFDTLVPHKLTTTITQWQLLGAGLSLEATGGAQQQQQQLQLQQRPATPQVRPATPLMLMDVDANGAQEEGELAVHTGLAYVLAAAAAATANEAEDALLESLLSEDGQLEDEAPAPRPVAGTSNPNSANVPASNAGATAPAAAAPSPARVANSRPASAAGGSAHGGNARRRSKSVLASRSPTPELPGDNSSAVQRSTLYKCVARGSAVEAEATVEVFDEYPLRPPVFLLQRLSSVFSEGVQPRAAMAVECAWVEQQVNIEAVEQALQAGADCEVLAVQVMRLRWCLDALSAESGSSEELLSKLQAKLKLRGRGRHVQLRCIE